MAELNGAIAKVTERIRARSAVRRKRYLDLIDEVDVSRPARVRFVAGLPKTRSGKLLRRAIQAVCEQRDPGDLTTIDDPSTLQAIRALLTTP